MASGPFADHGWEQVGTVPLSSSSIYCALPGARWWREPEGAQALGSAQRAHKTLGTKIQGAQPGLTWGTGSLTRRGGIWKGW